MGIQATEVIGSSIEVEHVFNLKERILLEKNHVNNFLKHFFANKKEVLNIMVNKYTPRYIPCDIVATVTWPNIEENSRQEYRGLVGISAYCSNSIIEIHFAIEYMIVIAIDDRDLNRIKLVDFTTYDLLVNNIQEIIGTIEIPKP